MCPDGRHDDDFDTTTPCVECPLDQFFDSSDDLYWAEPAVALGMEPYIIAEERPLVADTEVMLVNVPLEYEIGFAIAPGPATEDNWAAIVRFTATNTDCCEYGSRIPGVWFWPGARKLLVVDGHPDNGNAHSGEWRCDDSILTLNAGETHQVKLAMEASSIEVYVDGELACSEEHSKAWSGCYRGRTGRLDTAYTLWHLRLQMSPQGTIRRSLNPSRRTPLDRCRTRPAADLRARAASAIPAGTRCT